MSNVNVIVSDEDEYRRKFIRFEITKNDQTSSGVVVITRSRTGMFEDVNYVVEWYDEPIKDITDDEVIDLVLEKVL